MPNCKKCGNTIPDTAKFCNVCGTPVEQQVANPFVMPDETQYSSSNLNESGSTQPNPIHLAKPEEPQNTPINLNKEPNAFTEAPKAPDFSDYSQQPVQQNQPMSNGNNGFTNYTPPVENNPYGNIPPQQNQMYNNMYNPVPQQSTSNNGGLSIGGMVCGIISLISCCYGISIILGAVGIILSALGMSDNKKKGKPTPGTSIAGIICSAIGILLGILFWVLAIIGITYGDADTYSTFYNGLS